ncbi:MAG: extracellular solute-binding protein, partial [Halanaerobiales bacterium]
SEYLAEYKEKGITEVEDSSIKVQAEEAIRKSSATIYPIFDQSDPTVEPYHHSLLRLNVVGAERWQNTGEWVEWDVDVPEAGFYKIGLKAKQNLNRGEFTARRLYINGKTPFKEVETINFNYSSNYEMHVPGEDDPYLFYFDEGKNTIRLEVTMGDMASIIRETEDVLFELNTAFRQIIMITSSSPDRNRDYQLKRRIPYVIENLGNRGRQLQRIADDIENLSGEAGQQIARLREVARQMVDMSERPRTIQRRIGSFRDSLGNLGDWIMTAREQPLTLDYFVLAAPEEEMPETKPTTIQSASHEMKKYFASYFTDYDMVGDVYDEGELDQDPLTVWVVMGRDAGQILKRMIEDDFTSKTGIYVNMELVNLGVLLPATLAGRGPDVALGIEADAPINFAMRDAALDLTQFDDYEKVSQRFHESALVPFTFRDQVYALPQQQQFSMLFYRQDILSELGLGIPETWDDIFRIIPELQENNMEFGFPISDVAARRAVSADIGMSTAGAGSLSAHPGVTPFLTFLYQKDGDLYKPDGVTTDLHNERAIESFRMWTDFFELYKLPMSYNPQNRFRTGEMPLLISNYPLYNMLQVFAPEIRGKWDFTLVPGTMKEDGTIDRTLPGGALAQRAGAADMILKDSEMEDEAWEFLKWWNSTETQVRYGRELESMMGIAARYPTANLEASQLLPWTVEEFDKLEEQWQYVKGVPEVPGGYMTGRHLDNAFRRVINEQKEDRKMLLDYVRIIEEELEIKEKNLV